MEEKMLEMEIAAKKDFEKDNSSIRLPKNLRQIGTPCETQKVYVEDYVYTYLHSFIKEKYKNDTLRAAALFGEFKKQGAKAYAFVKGAIACDFSHLHEDVSAELSQLSAEYFPGWEMLGWYVSTQGVDGHIQSEIKHYYASAERDIPGYLIYEDELERETDIFLWEQNALHKLTGYYIYYEKNPRMQEFLIKEKGGRPQETPTYRPSPRVQEQSSYIYKEDNRIERDSQATHKKVETLKRTLEAKEKKEARKNTFAASEKKEVAKKTSSPLRQKERQEKQSAYRSYKLIYGACAVVLLVLVAMGVSQIGNYQNLQQLQEAISNVVVPGTSDEKIDNVQQQDYETQEQIESESQDVDSKELQPQEQTIPTDQELNKENPMVNDNSQDAPSETALQETASEEINVEKPEPVKGISQNSVQEEALEETASSMGTYTVKKGDNLFAISRAVYENENMVEQICELNGITNINLIYEGQTLNLP